VEIGVATEKIQPKDHVNLNRISRMYITEATTVKAQIVFILPASWTGVFPGLETK